jgi:CBS domain-containing protein
MQSIYGYGKLYNEGGEVLNILFFLTPKAMCSYIDADATLRQAMERMENSGYTALPVLDRDGGYCGVVTEGDLLWALKKLCVMDIRQTEEHSISELEHRRAVQPVRVDTRVEDLISVAAEQNFVPVVDDKGAFIGIVTRSRILKYCLETYFERFQDAAI